MDEDGAPQSAALSRVLTFLFTDIEGSTRRWEEDAAAMRAALTAHDHALQDAIDARDGRLFKHTGDGVCAAFASPRAAIDAAVTAQRSLALPVRMGIATGEAELRGDDYFGPVLNRAARLVAVGHGGQILLDGVTAELVSGMDLLELGPKHLRDIVKTVDVHQVRAAGLRTDFPALKTIDPIPGNLRLPTSNLIGREHELTELQSALATHRLVTLTGVGGVGKTRLAFEVAARIRTEFRDGVWVVELASVGDPAAVPEAVAAVLGVTQQPGKTMADSVARALEDRQRLLVFDNCEHVLDAAAEMMQAILTHSATVRILATSREGLRVAEEQLWPVPSLDVDSSAADLFCERALAVAPGTLLTRATVLEICRRLDGIPLGIELAASRMQSMTLTELSSRLDDRFRLLIGSRRAIERHQTLRHAVQWSFELLTASERAVLTMCSVFAGGFDLMGVRAVAAIGDDLATYDLLDSLVCKSLVNADRSSQETRFSMLETIRQFAEEQLDASEESERTRVAHARYFASRVAELFTVWDSPRQREAYTWLNVELANLRTAFRWAADHDDLESASAIATFTSFIGFWIGQHEAIAWAEELIDAAKTAEYRRLPDLYVMAALCQITGRLEDFLRYAELARNAIESDRYDDVCESFEATLGSGYLTLGQPERAIEWCDGVIARNLGTHTFARVCLVWLSSSQARRSRRWRRHGTCSRLQRSPTTPAWPPTPAMHTGGLTLTPIPHWHSRYSAKAWPFLKTAVSD